MKPKTGVETRQSSEPTGLIMGMIFNMPNCYENTRMVACLAMNAAFFHFTRPVFLRLLIAVSLPATLLLFLACCAQVPLTQRKSLHIMPDSQMLALGHQQYEKILIESKLSTDPEKTAMVRRVGDRIAGAAEMFLKTSGLEERIGDYDWDFNLIADDGVVNAWCMPGGKVAVYTGILSFTKDENGLAVVLGHEVAHAIAKHGNERMSQALLVELGGMALSAALSESPAQTRRFFMMAFGASSSIGFLLPYSRLHESEADRIGLMLTAGAGYDPREAISFWERMNEKKGSRPLEFLSTHPSSPSRIADIKYYIKEALPYYQNYQ